MNIARGIFFYPGRPGTSIKRGAGSSNVAVVQGDHLAVIDPGVLPGNTFRNVLAEMIKDGLNPENISNVLLTHGHWDHMNAAGFIQKNYKASLAVSHEDRALVENPGQFFDDFFESDHRNFRKEIAPVPQWILKMILWYSFGSQPAMKVDRLIMDGDRIDIGRMIEAISLPGHTPGMTGYFMPDCGVLISGDLFDFENSIGMDLTNFKSDLSSGLQSIRKVIQLGPEAAIPAHGKPIIGKDNVTKQLEDCISTVHQYLEKIENLLSGSPTTLTAITDKLFPKEPVSLKGMTMMLLVNMLRFLEKEGKVQRQQVGKKWVWAGK